MLDLTFTFNGKKSRALGLELQAPLTLSGAVPKVEITSVPGRNGDLHFSDGSFKNRQLSGSAYVLSANVARRIGLINSWLFGVKGYARLERDEDPDHFLLVRCTMGPDSTIYAGVLSACNISFDCKPQRFLKYGENTFDVTQSKTISNPTAFDALPIIILTGTGDVSVSSGGWTLSFKGLSGSVTYDAETLSAYDGNVSLNAKTGLSGDVILSPGENTFTVSGNVTSIKIIPRWWEI